MTVIYYLAFALAADPLRDGQPGPADKDPSILCRMSSRPTKQTGDWGLHKKRVFSASTIVRLEIEQSNDIQHQHADHPSHPTKDFMREFCNHITYCLVLVACRGGRFTNSSVIRIYWKESFIW